MTVLTEDTKAQKMRTAFGALAGQYMSEGRNKEAQGVLQAAMELNSDRISRVGGPFNESLARLYDIIVAS